MPLMDLSSAAEAALLAFVPVLVLIRLELEARRARRERAEIARAQRISRRHGRPGGRRAFDPEAP